MTIEGAIRNIITTNVSALAVKTSWSTVPQTTTVNMPYARLQWAGEYTRFTTAGSLELRERTFQVSVFGTDYLALAVIAESVITALNGKKGTFDAWDVQGIFHRSTITMEENNSSTAKEPIVFHFAMTFDILYNQ